MALYPVLVETRQGTAAERAAAEAEVDAFLQPNLRHLNCARSFRRLFKSDPVEAKEVYLACRKLVTTKS